MLCRTAALQLSGRPFGHFTDIEIEALLRRVQAVQTHFCQDSAQTTPAGYTLSLTFWSLVP